MLFGKFWTCSVSTQMAVRETAARADLAGVQMNLEMYVFIT